MIEVEAVVKVDTEKVTRNTNTNINTSTNINLDSYVFIIVKNSYVKLYVKHIEILN